MISVIPNRKKANKEFEYYVGTKIKELSKKGFIVCNVKYKQNEFKRHIGAIIRYKDKGYEST